MSLRDLRGDGRIDAVGLLAHQGFAGELEENALVGGGGGGHEEIIGIGAGLRPGLGWSRIARPCPEPSRSRSLRCTR